MGIEKQIGMNEGVRITVRKNASMCYGVVTHVRNQWGMRLKEEERVATTRTFPGGMEEQARAAAESLCAEQNWQVVR